MLTLLVDAPGFHFSWNVELRRQNAFVPSWCRMCFWRTSFMLKQSHWDSCSVTCDFMPVANCKLIMKIQGINDSLQHAQELSKLLSGRPVIAGIPRVDVRNSNPRFRTHSNLIIQSALSCTVIQNLTESVLRILDSFWLVMNIWKSG